MSQTFVRDQEKVGDPTEMLNLPIGMDLPVFQHVDQLVGVRLVERHAIAEPKMMEHARRRIDQGEDLHLAGLVEGLQVLEQKGVVAGLDANDVMRRAGRKRPLNPFVQGAAGRGPAFPGVGLAPLSWWLKCGRRDAVVCRSRKCHPPSGRPVHPVPSSSPPRGSTARTAGCPPGPGPRLPRSRSKYHVSHFRGLSSHSDNVAKIENSAAASRPLQCDPEP